MSPADLETIQSLIRSGDWHRLLGITTQLLAGSPDDRSVLLFRATARQALGNADGAISDLSRVIGTRPDYAAPWYSRGVCYLQLAVREHGPKMVLLLKRAVLDAEEGLLVEPGHEGCTQLRRQLATILPEEKNPSDAKPDYWAIAEKVAKVVGVFVGGVVK